MYCEYHHVHPFSSIISGFPIINSGAARTQGLIIQELDTVWGLLWAQGARALKIVGNSRNDLSYLWNSNSMSNMYKSLSQVLAAT